jgi:RNA polymerase sigma-70 factor (ECF subfamily)
VDRSLVEEARRGDRAAYEQLARGFSRQLFLVASRILRDRDAAEDAVQQALVAIWQGLPGLRDADRFEAWAYRLVVRAASDATRRERRNRVTLVDISSELPTDRDELGTVGLHDQLDRAFAKLAHDHRTVVVLHHLAGLSLAEIAQVLQIPYGTVGSRLHHAMKAMRAAVEAGDRVAPRGGQVA